MSCAILNSAIIPKAVYLLFLIVLPGLSIAFQQAAIEPVDCAEIDAAVQLQPGLFVRPGRNGIMFEEEGIANIGFIVGDRAIAVIDSGGSIKEGQRLICQIRKVSDLPIRYVINTHVHPDHMLGNGAFDDPRTTFIGHKNLAHAMGVLGGTYLRRYNEKTGGNLPDESIIPPQVKVSGDIVIELGNRPLTLIATPKAHTNNDLLVLDSKTGTLWLSDLLFHEHIPVMGKSGSVSGWIDVIKNLEQRNFNQVIPGHGPLNVDWNEAVTNQARYLSRLRDDIRENIKSNADLAHAVQSIGLSEAGKWQMFSRFHKRNISYIFSELEWE